MSKWVKFKDVGGRDLYFNKYKIQDEIHEMSYDAKANETTIELRVGNVRGDAILKTYRLQHTPEKIIEAVYNEGIDNNSLLTLARSQRCVDSPVLRDSRVNIINCG